MLEIARSYVAAGLSVIPIARDGSKTPDGRLLPQEWDEKEQRYKHPWKPYQKRLPTDAEVTSWFGGHRLAGIGIVGGEVSGGLEQIDFDIDAQALARAWRDLVEAEAPGLVARLSIVQTPRQPAGYHVRYRISGLAVPGNTKFAEEPCVDPVTGKRKPRTLIETRGEGGYALAPGSPLECHETGRPYVHIAGPPLTDLPVLTAEEREILIRCACSLTRDAEEKEPRQGSSTFRVTAGPSPGDDYSLHGPDWGEILERHGWQCVRTSGAVRYWARPGKERGWSATTGYCHGKDGRELLAVFSSNADPFPGPAGGRTCSAHSKFAAYALLDHGGDFSAAAQELARQGFGSQAHERNGDAAEGEPPDDEEPAAPTAKRPTAAAIILAYLRQHYRPLFRRGGAIFSATQGCAVERREAAVGPSEALITQLQAAAEQGKRKGRAARNAVPKLHQTWFATAWRELWESLPEEEECAEINEQAEVELRSRLAGLLGRVVSLGRVVGEGQEACTVVEQRSLLDCALLWAEAGKWARIRSWWIWCRLEGKEPAISLRKLPAKEVEAHLRERRGRLRVAIRTELLEQMHVPGLSGIRPARLLQLCQFYQLGTEVRIGHGRTRAIAMAPDYLADLLADPSNEEDPS